MCFSLTASFFILVFHLFRFFPSCLSPFQLWPLYMEPAADMAKQTNGASKSCRRQLALALNCPAEKYPKAREPTSSGSSSSSGSDRLLRRWR